MSPESRMLTPAMLKKSGQSTFLDGPWREWRAVVLSPEEKHGIGTRIEAHLRLKGREFQGAERSAGSPGSVPPTEPVQKNGGMDPAAS